MKFSGDQVVQKLRSLFVNEYLLLVGIVLFGLFLRLINLGAEPYWADEILSLDIVKHFNNLGGLINYLKLIEIHPPLYYLMLHYWIGWFGTGELAVRLLSLLFGLGIIFFTYVVGKKMFSQLPKFGLWAAFIVAILPFQINFSEEARPYITYCFFGLLNIFGLWGWLKEHKVKWFVLYIVSSILGLYLHYSYFYILVASSTFWVMAEVVQKIKPANRWLVQWLGAHFLIFLGFYWWLDALLYKVVFLGKYEIFGLARSTVGGWRSINLFESVFNQIIWLNQRQMIRDIEIVAILLFKMFLVYCITYLLIKKRDQLFKIGLNGFSAISLWCWMLIVPIVFFIFTPQSIPYSPIYERHIILGSVALAFLLSFVLVNLEIRRRLVILCLFVASLLPFITMAVSDNTIWNPSYRVKLVADYINENYREKDLVLVENSPFRSDFNYYLKPNISATGLYPTELYGFDYLQSRQTLGLVENEAQLRIKRPTREDVFKKISTLVKINKSKRVWIVSPAFSDNYTQSWFRENKWRHVFRSLGELFPVDLYSIK